MGAGGDDIIRTADCREHHRPRSPMAARCFTQGVLWTDQLRHGRSRARSRYKMQSPASGGVYHFYSLRWIAGIVLRKEALGMGDVLLFAALGSWVGPLSLPMLL